jgi:hypothetical protein
MDDSCCSRAFDCTDSGTIAETGAASEGPADLAYQAARSAVCARSDPLPFLRQAAEAGHAAATADLAALAGSASMQAGRSGRWLRQHCEVVAIASTNPGRAEALLRDHAAEFGCDPLALFVVAGCLDGINGMRLQDLRGRACSC